TVFTLEEKRFINIESMEVQLRKILVRRGKTRPEQRMPCHTGWLVFASKTIKETKTEPKIETPVEIESDTNNTDQ
ncbi:MAG: hypothetical protein KAJ14_15535, partial [Candidatus Omnitrophica bacterium]|nr:hypothetical protein [Candidatus Omnitrophota bacterium]